MKNSKQGFTLAEVLITLGIIGVVAAITMPMLIGHYNKQVWVNQLKKTVSTLENGVKLMMAEDGVDLLHETSAWSYVPSSGCTTYSSCPSFYDNLKKYFNITYSTNLTSGQYYKYLDMSGNGTYPSKVMLAHFPSGADISFTAGKTPTSSGTGGSVGPMPSLVELTIDVNGVKKEPNKLGRDVFLFAISEKGRLIAYGSPAAVREYCFRFPEPSASGCYNSLSNSFIWSKDSTANYVNCGKNSLGYTCAARIMAEGWKMNY